MTVAWSRTWLLTGGNGGACTPGSLQGGVTTALFQDAGVLAVRPFPVASIPVGSTSRR